MNRRISLALLPLLFVAGLFLLPLARTSQNQPVNLWDASSPSKKTAEKGREEKIRQIRARFEQEFMQMRDPKTNTVPMERLRAAEAYRQSLLASGKINAAIPGVNWTERGPNNVAGRTRAILVDPNDATGNTVFSAGVAGGLWKTTNMGAATPSWAPVNDFFTNLAITCLAADPSNPQVMYFGTGEGYANLDAVRGDGIWKTTDGGTTWNQLASTTAATFDFVQKIAVNSTGIVLAATASGGIQRSTNGGTTWTKVLGSGLGITGAGNNFAYDVDIAANGDVYATLNGSIHKSTNAGLTFGAAQTVPITLGRVEIACAPNDANYVYALVENANVVNGILRSINGGTNWVSRTEPVDLDGGIPATDFSRDQAWYDLTIAVDPNNKDRLFVGAVDLFVSADGAGTWTQVAHWYGGFSRQYVHADQHAIQFAPGSSAVCYFGNDGGIFRTANANAAMPTISFKGNGYNVTQFYGCAIHPTAFTDHYLAGAQDNGSHLFSGPAVNSTTEVTGGDGAFCHIDQDEPQFQFTQYVYNDYYRSVDGGQTWTNITSGTTGQFINPTDYDNTNDILYASHNAGQYLRWSDPQTGATFTGVTVAAFGGGTVNAVTVSPNTAHRVFFGINNGRVVSCTNANAAPTGTNISTGLPAAAVSCIEVETGNDNHLLVTYSNFGVNSVWESINGGTSWTSVEGNLPDMPIRWALFNPNNSDQAMVATELGVWTTDNLNGAATVWGPSNTGLANVRTDMLQLRQSDKFVIAATHGRGLYSTDAFCSPTALFGSNRQVQYTSTNIQFIDQSYRATSWLWNFGDGTTSTSQNPVKTYTAPGLYTVSLTINGGAASLSKTNFIQILPDLGTPYALTDGGSFDVNPLHFGPENWSGTPWQLGNSAVAGKNGTFSGANAWVTGLVGNYADNSNVELYCPNYNFTAAGTYTLRFRSKRNTEANYDGFRVEYSTNKGSTWLPLGTTTAANWYNFANTVGDAVFPINEAFFAGAATTYALMTRDVSFLAGNPQVAFRFVFKSDGSVNAAGVNIDDFEILGPSNPAGGFPVEGSPLVAEWAGEDVALSWETYKETNSDRFVLERSTDGILFSPIVSLQAQGNSSTTHAYFHLDTKPNGERLYYRYRQLDLDGSESFSNTVELSRADMDEAFAPIVYPNAFLDELSIRIAGNIPLGTELAIFDVSGREWWFEQFNGTSTDLWTLRSQVLALEPGVYFVRLQSNGRVKTTKVIKR